MLYVEPIYLQSETSAYPELRLVAVMHNDNLSYAETFEEALTNLYEETTREAIGKEVLPGTKASIRELTNRANRAFEDYLDFMQQKNFQQAGDALEELHQSLQQLENGNIEENLNE